MNEPKLCQHCKWARPCKAFQHENRCYHPLVIANDAWALGNSFEGDVRGYGVDCRTERDKSWLKGQCGMRGALWEPK